MKKSILFFTMALFLFTSLAYAGGERGTRAKRGGFGGSMLGGTSFQTRMNNWSGSRNIHRGTMGSGTLNQSRKQIHNNVEKGTGDMTRSRIQKRDESCDQ